MPISRFRTVHALAFPKQHEHHEKLPDLKTETLRRQSPVDFQRWRQNKTIRSSSRKHRSWILETIKNQQKLKLQAATSSCTESITASIVNTKTNSKHAALSAPVPQTRAFCSLLQWEITKTLRIFTFSCLLRRRMEQCRPERCHRSEAYTLNVAPKMHQVEDHRPKWPPRLPAYPFWASRL